MNKTLWMAVALLCCRFCFTAGAAEQTNSARNITGRIGVYDSRAAAVAFSGSKAYNRSMAPLWAERDQAKAAGNRERVKELEAQGRALQTLRHKQAFSTAPVDDILEHIKDRLPEIIRQAGVKTIVSKWDAPALKHYPQAEQVDVTLALVEAFEPDERQRKNALEIQKHPPISLKQAENIKD